MACGDGSEMLSAVALGMRGRSGPSSRSSMPCMLFAKSCCTVRSRSLCWWSRCSRVWEGVGADAGKGDCEQELGTNRGLVRGSCGLSTVAAHPVRNCTLAAGSGHRFSSTAMVLSCSALSWSSSRRVAGSRDMVQSCSNSSRGSNMYDHCEGCTHVTVCDGLVLCARYLYLRFVI